MLLFYLLLAKNPPSVPPRCTASSQRCHQALLTTAITSTSCDWLPVQFSAALTLFSSCPTRAHTFTSLQADLLFMHVYIVPNDKQKHTNSFFPNFYSPITWCIFWSILCQETKANVQHWLFKSQGWRKTSSCTSTASTNDYTHSSLTNENHRKLTQPVCHRAPPPLQNFRPSPNQTLRPGAHQHQPSRIPEKI